MRRFIVLFMVLTATVLTADTERISRYISSIHVHRDGSMTVNEEITVFAAGQNIKRGIYRDFPLYYKDRTGNNINVQFKILNIKKNGRDEPYHTENLRNGLRIYIGSKDVYLKRDYYTYTISYRTNRQLGFFEKHDELYWNVTGNGWLFPIDYARCSIFLPDSISPEDIRANAFTGAMGETGDNYSITDKGSSFVGFETTERLGPYEGLTIVAGWPKGFVREPTDMEKIQYFLWDNIHVFIAVLGLILLFAYYMWAWIRVGKDPARGTIIPLYEAPEGLSPGALRYIMRMKYDNKVFTSIIMNLGVRGYIKVSEEKKKFIINKLKEADGSLSPDECIVMDNMFENSSSIALERKNRLEIMATLSLLKKELTKQYKNSMFYLNSKYTVPAILISIVTIIAAFLSSNRIGGESMFLYIWMSFWTIGVLIMASAGIRGLREGIGSSDKKQILGSIILMIVFIPFIAVEIVVLIVFSRNIPILFNIIVILMIGLHALFFDLLKAPSLAGRRIMDKIEGFRMYLASAERDTISVHEGPPENIDTYEKYLPFAFALDAENKWTARFQAVIDNISAQQNAAYHPMWYTGTRSFSHAGFASSLGSSINSAVASSSASSSSSGFSGGSSGGGGGGGGGGGW